MLYGDWSAKWYGDPTERLIYWPQATWAGTSASKYGISHNFITDFDPVTEGAGNWNHTYWLNRQGATYVWHLFDVAAGVDVGVDE